MRLELRLHGILAGVCLGLMLSPGSAAAQPGNPRLPNYHKPTHQKGPCAGDMGNAIVQVPANYYFVPRHEMPQLNNDTGNPPAPRDVGAVYSTDGRVLVFFSFTDDGYVKDTDKNSIDADAILADFRAGNEEGNKWRRENKQPELTLVGWETKPYYDEKTNNLTWATRNSCEGIENINHESRLLGRKGVTSALLVCSPVDLQNTIGMYNEMLKGFAYKPGERYAEFNPSTDKVAAYTLGGLFGVGAVALAAKSGLLTKFLKPIIVGVIALFAGIAALFRRMFGGRSTT